MRMLEARIAAIAALIGLTGVLLFTPAGKSIVLLALLQYERLRGVTPVQNGDAVSWQGGTVSNWDYSVMNPGSYENAIEWIGPDGRRTRLVFVGDTEPSLCVLPDGRLQASFSARDPPREVTLTWRRLGDRPTRLERPW